MILKPLFDRVVVKEIKPKEQTVGGIFIPSSTQEKPCIATVVSVGNGNVIDNKTEPMQVNVGDKVVFAKYAGSEFKLDSEEFIILKQTDILAVLED